MKLLLTMLCVLSVASAAAAAAEKLPGAPCVRQTIGERHVMEMPSSNAGSNVYAPVQYAQGPNSYVGWGDFVGRYNSAMSSRLGSRSVCLKVREPSSEPTRLVRITLARGVVAWKAVAAE